MENIINDTRDAVMPEQTCYRCGKTADNAPGLRYYFAFERFLCDACFPQTKADFMRSHFIVCKPV